MFKNKNNRALPKSAADFAYINTWVKATIRYDQYESCTSWLYENCEASWYSISPIPVARGAPGNIMEHSINVLFSDKNDRVKFILGAL